jgi:hypothetical protein
LIALLCGFVWLIADLVRGQMQNSGLINRTPGVKQERGFLEFFGERKQIIISLVVACFSK